MHCRLCYWPPSKQLYQENSQSQATFNIIVTAITTTNPKIMSTNFFWSFIIYFLFSAYRSNLLERIIKVGAQSPTKIPNLSPCACKSGDLPPVRYQIAIEPAIERNPRTRQIVLVSFSCVLFIKLFYPNFSSLLLSLHLFLF